MKTTVFTFKTSTGKTLRAINIHGRLWYMAADLAKLLNIRQSAAGMWLYAGKDNCMIRYQKDRRGRNKHIHVVNDIGVYTMLMTLNDPVSVDFRHWITREVLSQIQEKHYYWTTGETWFDRLGLWVDYCDEVELL